MSDRRTSRKTASGAKSKSSKLPSSAQVVSLARATSEPITQFVRYRTESVTARATTAECARDMARFEKEDREGQRQYALKSQENERKERQANLEHERKLEASRAATRAADQRLELVKSCAESLQNGDMSPEGVGAIAQLLGKAR